MRYLNAIITLFPRFSKPNVTRLCEIFPRLQRDRRGGGLRAELRLCIFLAYCAENGYQYTLGQRLGVRKSTVSAVVADVANVICSRSREFIK